MFEKLPEPSHIRCVLFVLVLTSFLCGCMMPNDGPTGTQEGYPPLGTEVQRFYAPDNIGNLVWSPDQRYLAGSDKHDTTVYLWNAESGREIWRRRKVRGSGYRGNGLAFTSDGRAIITSFVGVGRERPEATLSVLSVRDGSVLRDVYAPLPEHGMNYSHNFSIDKDQVAVSLGGSRVGIFDEKDWSLIRMIGPVLNKFGNPAGIDHVALDVNRDIVVLGWGGLGFTTVQTWKLSENRKVAEFEPYSVSGITAMAINRDSGRLVTGGDMVITWPKEELAKYGPIDFSTSIRDDHWRLVRGWNPLTGEREIVYAGPESMQRTLNLSPDGRWLAAANSGSIRTNHGYATIWNLERGEIRGVRIHGDNRISGVSFSPDGRKLAYAVASHIYIVDVSSIVSDFR